MRNGLEIPFFGIDRQYANLREEILATSDRVYKTGKVLDGQETELFENAIAKRCHRRYAIAVNSGTMALIFAFNVLELKNAVIATPPVSFVATVNSVVMSSNIPAFSDSDDSAQIDFTKIDLSDPQLKCIVGVNLFGNMCDWEKASHIQHFWAKERPFLVEDAAQSFGASYKGHPSGSFGDISILSFDPTKNLPNYGSGGMILTDDDDLHRMCRDLRNNANGGFLSVGTNAKMSEVDCAQMRVKLKYFDGWQKRRTEIAKYYTRELSNFVDIIPPAPEVVHAWHKFVIRAVDREALTTKLLLAGIATKIHYPAILPDTVAGQYYAKVHGDMYFSLAHCKEALSLPIYPELTDTEVEYIVSTIKKFYI